MWDWRAAEWKRSLTEALGVCSSHSSTDSNHIPFASVYGGAGGSGDSEGLGRVPIFNIQVHVLLSLLRYNWNFWNGWLESCGVTPAHMSCQPAASFRLHNVRLLLHSWRLSCATVSMASDGRRRVKAVRLRIQRDKSAPIRRLPPESSGPPCLLPQTLAVQLTRLEGQRHQLFNGEHFLQS